MISLSFVLHIPHGTERKAVMTYTDLLFVFGLLPAYIIIVFVCRENWEKNVASLIFSLVFILWARPAYYALVVIDLFVIYAVGRFKHAGRYKAARAAALGFTGLTLLPMLLSPGEGVGQAVASLGFGVFWLRSLIYLRDKESETNFLNLAVYLISLEFMTVAPLMTYSEMKEQICKRKVSLAMLAAGFERFACGLFAVTVLGYPLERLRAAAMLSGSVPYLNAIVGLAATAVLIYTALFGFLSMSEGLCLIGGFRVPLRDAGFLPKSLIIDHVRYSYPPLWDSLRGIFDDAGAAALPIAGAVFCLLTGAGIGFGAAGLAFAGVIGAALVMQMMFETRRTAAAGVFSALMWLAAVIAATGGSVFGIADWFAAFAPGKYEFDIGFELYNELGRSLVWGLLAVAYVSPLRMAAGRRLREAMGESETAYGAVRLAGVVISVAALALSAVAMVSAV